MKLVLLEESRVWSRRGERVLCISKSKAFKRTAHTVPRLGASDSALRQTHATSLTASGGRGSNLCHVTSFVALHLLVFVFSSDPFMHASEMGCMAQIKQ
eukprot:3253691-Rhodomonas_salina.2